MNKNFYFLIVPIMLLTILMAVLHQAAIAEPSEPEAITTSTLWENGKALTNNSNTNVSAIQPAIATAPGGKTIIVAYMKQTGALDSPEDADPFYVRSTNNGRTWSQPAKIYQNAALPTRFVDITLDSNATGHAVWTENEVQLRYSKQSQWAGNSFTTIHSIPTGFGNLIDSPKIIFKGSNRLHVVWSQQTSFDGDIYHMTSSNGGTSWSTAAAIGNDGSVNSVSPSLAATDNGNLHVVWEAQIASFPSTHAEIFYARSSNNGVTWTSPITISQVINPGPDRVFAQPKIVAQGNSVHVAFENRPNDQEQRAYYATCTSGCANINNWRGNDVTVQNYRVKNTDPAFLKPQPAILGGCAVVLFSGINGDPGSNDEKIRESSSCGNWSSNPTVSGVDSVLSGNLRAIRPSVVSSNGWWLYLAFERKGSTRSDIYFVRNIPALYLPVIIKQ